MKFKRYPEYKDSGVEWLGEIPAHWDIFPLRRKLVLRPDGIKIGPFGSQLKLEYMTNSGYKVYGQDDWPLFPRKLWQGNYHEHIIRNENKMALFAISHHMGKNALKARMRLQFAGRGVFFS